MAGVNVGAWVAPLPVEVLAFRPPPPTDPFGRLIYGTDRNDTLTGTPFDDRFFASRGTDTFIGLAGQDTLIGINPLSAKATQFKPGWFRLEAEFSAVNTTTDGQLTFTPASRGLAYLNQVEWIQQDLDTPPIPLSRISVPTPFNDQLTAPNPNSPWVVDGLAGDDFILGGLAGDTLRGGPGNDRLDGGRNTMAIDGRFKEVLIGGNGNDTLIYQGFWPESSAEIPSSVQVRLEGGEGNDTLEITLDRISHVSVSGGAGTDTLLIQPSAQVPNPWMPTTMYWSYTLHQGQWLLQGVYTDDLHQGESRTGVFETDSSIEFLALASAPNQPYRIVRPSGDEDLTGTQSSDIILTPGTAIGGTIEAAAGNDLVLAHGGWTVSLGAGFNELYALETGVTLDYHWSSNGISLDLQAKRALVLDQESNLVALDRLFVAPSNVIGSNADDAITGDLNNNRLTGGAGDDYLLSLGGDDILMGGIGNDTLVAKGQGSVILEGGEGADTFILYKSPREGTVTVADASWEQGDRVQFDLGTLSRQTGEWYGAYTIELDDGQSVSRTLDNGYEGLLRLSLSEETRSLTVAGGQDFGTWAYCNESVFDLSAEQIATLITLDYL